MGGNALKTVTPIRVTKHYYDSIINSIQDAIDSAVTAGGLPDDLVIRPILAYANKVDYGDADILVYSSKYDPFQLAHVLGADEVVRNGPVSSIAMPLVGGNHFQVDFIFTNDMEWAAMYFDYNDFGNLVGRVAARLGFKFGHDGLWYVLRDSENKDLVIEELLVTRDMETAFMLIGYDWRKYCETDFVDLEDVFHYVVANPYFDKSIYLLENRNHVARQRDKKRKTYMRFLEWLENDAVAWYSSSLDLETIRMDRLKMAYDIFDPFRLAYDVAVRNHAIIKESKQKFNGELVQQWTGLQSGPKLGEVIQDFKLLGHRDETLFNSYVAVTSAEIISLHFKMWWERNRHFYV